MPAMIGIVMLMGLVTKNAILLVDYTNQRRREGLGVEAAILAAGPVRLRPILMTTSAMILGMMPAAIGLGEGRRVPRADGAGNHRRPDHLDAADAGAGAGGLPAAGADDRARRGVVAPDGEKGRHTARAHRVAPRAAWPEGPAWSNARSRRPRLRQAGRLVPASPGSARPDLELTIDRARALAAERSESFKVARERVRESESLVAEAKAGFLPSIDFSYLYTPAVRFPLIRIPAGIFGPDELSFQAAFTRQNIMRVDLTQPIYTGGRLRTAHAIRQAGLDQARFQEDRARQALALQVVRSFYAALLGDQGMRVADEGVRLADSHLSIARTRFDAGTAARLDVLKGEVDRAAARTRLIRARSARDIAYQGLRAVLSLPADTTLRLLGTLDAPQPVPAKADLAASLAARPDLESMRVQRRMAEGAATLARAALKPTVAVTGNVQYQEDALSIGAPAGQPQLPGGDRRPGAALRGPRSLRAPRRRPGPGAAGGTRAQRAGRRSPPRAGRRVLRAGGGTRDRGDGRQGG